MSLKQYVTLGRSGLRVSPFSLGTMTFGTEWGWGSEESDARAVFNATSKQGAISWTRRMAYTIGKSEELVGQVYRGARSARSRGPGDKVYLQRGSEQSQCRWKWAQEYLPRARRISASSEDRLH